MCILKLQKNILYMYIHTSVKYRALNILLLGKENKFIFSCMRAIHIIQKYYPPLRTLEQITLVWLFYYKKYSTKVQRVVWCKKSIDSWHTYTCTVLLVVKLTNAAIILWHHHTWHQHMWHHHITHTAFWTGASSWCPPDQAVLQSTETTPAGPPETKSIIILCLYIHLNVNL